MYLLNKIYKPLKIFLEIKHNLAVQVHTNYVHLHTEIHEDVGIGENHPPCLTTTTLRSVGAGFFLEDTQHTLTHYLSNSRNFFSS